MRMLRADAGVAMSGLGWNITAPGTANENFSKNGSTAGFSSYIGFSRPRQTGFAVLCNGPNAGKDLAPRLYEVFAEPAVPVEDTQPPHR
jgi:CubicO group peptidase (beta-lactamase class C family)